MTIQRKKLFASAAISAALILSPLGAVSQTSPTTDTATTSQTTTTNDRPYRDGRHNYGWIGLLGLLGLTGLLRKRDNRNTVEYAERTDSRRPTVGARN